MGCPQRTAFRGGGGSDHAERNPVIHHLLVGHGATVTQHPRILCSAEPSVCSMFLNSSLAELETAVGMVDARRAREALIKGVPEYTPADDVVDRVCEEIEGRSREAEPVDPEEFGTGKLTG